MADLAPDKVFLVHVSWKNGARSRGLCYSRDEAEHVAKNWHGIEPGTTPHIREYRLVPLRKRKRSTRKAAP